jgi:PEP-CTERM motif-containing protein
MRRWITPIAAGLLCLAARTSVAATVTIDFSGTVVSVYDYVASPTTPSLNDGSIQVGTPFSGRLVLDTSTAPDSVQSDPFESSAYTMFTGPRSQFSVTVGNYTVAASPSFSVGLRNLLPPDEFGDGMGALYQKQTTVGSNILTVTSSLGFNDPTDTWLTNPLLADARFDQLPTYSSVIVTWVLGTPDLVGVAILEPGFQIDSMHVTVPEPGALALVGLALGVAVARRR